MGKENIYVKFNVILILLLLFIKTSLSVSNIVEDIKDAVLSAERFLGSTGYQLEKLASHFQNAKNALDDTIEEDCVYLCPNGKKPVPNKYYKPHSNGCGVNGMEIKIDSLPFKDMTRCCDVHDICYGTCGSIRDKCDLEFKECLYRICDGKLSELSRECKTAAKVLYTGTNVLGCKFFKDAQREACYCSQEKRRYRGDDEL